MKTTIYMFSLWTWKQFHFILDCLNTNVKSHWLFLQILWNRSIPSTKKKDQRNEIYKSLNCFSLFKQLIHSNNNTYILKKNKKKQTKKHNCIVKMYIISVTVFVRFNMIINKTIHTCYSSFVFCCILMYLYC